MTAAAPRPILVTGPHRSGTTWVGRMIASHPGVAYLAEPFNVRRPPSPVCHFFHHVTPAEESAFRTYLGRLLTFRDPAPYQVRSPWPWCLPLRAARTVRCWWRRLCGCRPLVKDPTAFFSAAWLARAFAADVVVLMRHPAAFASSLKRLNAHFDFHALLAQPELLRAHGLEEFADEIRACARRPPDLIGQAALLWQVFAAAVLRYRREHPDWVFLRHEDLSADPVASFARLLPRLGLRLTPGVRRTLEEHTSPDNPREAPPGVAHQLRRDSRANIWSWKARLRPEEVERLRRETEGLARLFYADADWDGDGRQRAQAAPHRAAARAAVPQGRR
jgi:hypothetical protein